MGKIGITTTIPVETIFAAGHQPVDLNNIFITDPERRAWMESAEIAGFPATICGWIKGIYSAAKAAGVEAVVGVMAGDCSNTQALLEIWKFEGLRTIPFAYPYDRSSEALTLEIRRLCERMGTTLEAAEAQKRRLDPIRRKAAEVDRLTWREDKVSGAENHIHLVTASDFGSDPATYEAGLDGFLAEARQREPFSQEVRLGLIGVPTVYDDFYEFLESVDARVVLNETQRQFALPYFDDGLVEAYRKFTYPYEVFARIDDIRDRIAERRIDGIIHYVQSFCFRQMEDVIFRKTLGVPVLTIEGDRPMELDARTRNRLESFVEMLSAAL